MCEGEKVRLRAMASSDFPKIVEWSRDPCLGKFVDYEYPRSIEECKAWYKLKTSNRSSKIFVIVTSDGEPIGDVEFLHISWRRKEGELRVRIGEKHLWDHGYGTDAVRTALQHAKSEMGLQRVYLRVYSFNARAIRCYEKCGFTKVGRLRRRTSGGEIREILLMTVDLSQLHPPGGSAHERQNRDIAGLAQRRVNRVGLKSRASHETSR